MGYRESDRYDHVLEPGEIGVLHYDDGHNLQVIFRHIDYEHLYIVDVRRDGVKEEWPFAHDCPSVTDVYTSDQPEYAELIAFIATWYLKTPNIDLLKRWLS